MDLHNLHVLRGETRFLEHLRSGVLGHVGAHHFNAGFFLKAGRVIGGHGRGKNLNRLR